MANNRKITITSEDGNVENALVTFIETYKSNIVDFLRMSMQQSGVESDPEIAVYKSDDGVDSISVFRVNPSKGAVVTVNDDSASFVEYEDVEMDSKYLEEGTGGKWNVFLKTGDGEADANIGHFKSLREGISNIDSDQVAEAIKRRESYLEDSKKEKSPLSIVEDAEVVDEKEGK